MRARPFARSLSLAGVLGLDSCGGSGSSSASTVNPPPPASQQAWSCAQYCGGNLVGSSTVRVASGSAASAANAVCARGTSCPSGTSPCCQCANPVAVSSAGGVSSSVGLAPGVPSPLAGSSGSTSTCAASGGITIFIDGTASVAQCACAGGPGTSTFTSGPVSGLAGATSAGGLPASLTCGNLAAQGPAPYGSGTCPEDPSQPCVAQAEPSATEPTMLVFGANDAEDGYGRPDIPWVWGYLVSVHDTAGFCNRREEPAAGPHHHLQPMPLRERLPLPDVPVPVHGPGETGGHHHRELRVRLGDVVLRKRERGYLWTHDGARGGRDAIPADAARAFQPAEPLSNPAVLPGALTHGLAGERGVRSERASPPQAGIGARLPIPLRRDRGAMV